MAHPIIARLGPPQSNGFDKPAPGRRLELSMRQLKKQHGAQRPVAKPEQRTAMLERFRKKA